MQWRKSIYLINICSLLLFIFLWMIHQPGREDKTGNKTSNSRQTFVYKASLSLENGHLVQSGCKVIQATTSCKGHKRLWSLLESSQGLSLAKRFKDQNSLQWQKQRFLERNIDCKSSVSWQTRRWSWCLSRPINMNNSPGHSTCGLFQVISSSVSFSLPFFLSLLSFHFFSSVLLGMIFIPSEQGLQTRFLVIKYETGVLHSISFGRSQK